MIGTVLTYPRNAAQMMLEEIPSGLLLNLTSLESLYDRFSRSLTLSRTPFRSRYLFLFSSFLSLHFLNLLLFFTPFFMSSMSNCCSRVNLHTTSCP